MKSRREFLKLASFSALGVTLLRAEMSSGSASRVLRVGVIGCGGRGLGAAMNVLAADPDVKIFALADVFPEAISRAKQAFSARAERLDLAPEREFSGLDAYQKLLATDVDLVILAAPPVFRPDHLMATVRAGKHAFVEKPMAVDMAGVQQLILAAKLAREKKLHIQHGFCWRFSLGMRAAKVAVNDLGRLVSFYGTFLTTPVKPLPEGISEDSLQHVAEQIRWWQNYRWTSGGPLVEQGIHTIDQMSAMLGDQAPIAVVGCGGQAQRRGALDVYDHYQVTFEYPGGVFCHVVQRQFSRAFSEIHDRFFYANGTMIGPDQPMILNPDQSRRWVYRPDPTQEQDMYQLCQNEWIAGICAGEVTDSWNVMIHLTKLALMARRAAETGQRVTWADMENDSERICSVPASLQEVRKIPKPIRPGE